MGAPKGLSVGTVLAAHGAWNDSTLCWLIHTEPLCSALPTAVAAAVSCPHTEPVARRSLKRRLCTAEHLPAHNGIQCSVLPARRQQCSGACTNAMGRSRSEVGAFAWSEADRQGRRASRSRVARHLPRRGSCSHRCAAPCSNPTAPIRHCRTMRDGTRLALTRVRTAHGE